MILATKEDYLSWQQRIKTDPKFKNWWQFWSNYSWLFLLPVVFYLLLYSPDKHTIVKVAVAFVFARIILVPIISLFFPKKRPYQEYDFPPLTSIFLSQETKSQNSFPSSHIISITAASGAMLFVQPIFTIIFLVIGIFTGLGRVVLGFHYPKDIIFSLISGLIIGVIVALLI